MVRRTKYRNDMIDNAVIEMQGDPSVGIQDYVCVITGVGFDLACLGDTDIAPAIEEFRENLADAFEVVLGDRPSVWFENER